MSEAGRERRREVRVHSVNLINYSSLRRPEHPEEHAAYALLGTARTDDLSGSGCRLITSEPVPLGLQLTLDLKLADMIVHCKGKVVRVAELEPERTWGIGVEFLGLDELAQDGIRAYLEFSNGGGDLDS